MSNANFIRAALQARLGEGEELEAVDYYHRLYEKMDLLDMRREFTSRSVNEGFSGGEKEAQRNPANGDARTEVMPCSTRRTAVWTSMR